MEARDLISKSHRSLEEQLPLNCASSCSSAAVPRLAARPTSAKQTKSFMEAEQIFRAPRVQPKLHAAAKQYLEQQGIVLPANQEAPKLLAAIVESEVAHRLERMTRDGYYRSLALGAATYLYIDSRPDRSELLDACAARLKTKRKETTNDVALVLRCLINYGEQTRQHRIKHRQFWSRDAKMIGELLAQGVSPDQMSAELQRTGLRSGQRGSIASIAAANGRKGSRVSNADSDSAQDFSWVHQAGRLIRKMPGETLLILAIRKKKGAPTSARVCGSITLPYPGHVSKLDGWRHLQKTTLSAPKARRFH